MIDWELLGSRQHDRVEVWRQAYKDTHKIQNRQATEYDAICRFEQLLNNPIFGNIAKLQEWWCQVNCILRLELFRWHSQDLNEDKRYLFHARGWLRFLTRWLTYVDAPCLYLSASIPTELTHAYIDIGGEYKAIGVSVALWGVGAVWIDLQNVLSRKFVMSIAEYGAERRIGISFNHGVLSIEIWRDANEFSGNNGIHKRFRVQDFLLGNATYTTEKLSERTVDIEMPEKLYPARVTMNRVTWGRPRSPFKTTRTRAEIELVTPIPIPGKGENSYDQDEDAVHSLNCDASTIEQAIDILRESVLRSRVKYGGMNWASENLTFEM